MKNAIRYFQILLAIWPEVTKLIKHIMAMLPEDEHVPAAKHMMKEGMRTLPKGADTAWIMPPHVKTKTWHRDLMKDMDLENF